MESKESRARSEEQSVPLTGADEILARFFDVLIEMDFEEQHNRRVEEKQCE